MKLSKLLILAVFAVLVTTSIASAQAEADKVRQDPSDRKYPNVTNADTVILNEDTLAAEVVTAMNAFVMNNYFGDTSWVKIKSGAITAIKSGIDTTRVLNSLEIQDTTSLNARIVNSSNTDMYGHAGDTVYADAKDTLSRLITSATNSLSPTVPQHFTVTISSMDTCALKLSFQSAMGVNKVYWIPGGGSRTIPTMDIASITNAYVTRRWNVAGPATYEWSFTYR